MTATRAAGGQVIDGIEDAAHDGFASSRVALSRPRHKLAPHARVSPNDAPCGPAPQGWSHFSSDDDRAIVGAVVRFLLVRLRVDHR